MNDTILLTPHKYFCCLWTKFLYKQVNHQVRPSADRGIIVPHLCSLKTPLRMLVDAHVYVIRKLFRLQDVIFVQNVPVVQLGDKYYSVIFYFSIILQFQVFVAGMFRT